MFTQGHPEYDADTLAREYRRDVLRFLTGESNSLPSPPINYFSDETLAALDELARSAKSINRQRLAERFSRIIELETPGHAWSNDAANLYRNWLTEVATQRLRGRSAQAIA